MAAESAPVHKFPAAARIAGLVVFAVVLYFADWLTYAASFALFRVDPRTIPEDFFIAYQLPSLQPGVLTFECMTWERYRSAERPSIGALRLAEPSGRIPLKGSWLIFRVLEDDGQRQLVEVSNDGFHPFTTRYEAYSDRVVPLAYRGRSWAIGWVGGLLLAGAAAWLTLGVTRLIRLRRT